MNTLIWVLWSLADCERPLSFALPEACVIQLAQPPRGGVEARTVGIEPAAR
jgi:hypothetical protein